MQTVTSASLASMMAARDNKRVSFHDEENNLIMGQSSSDQAELSIVREDPNVCVPTNSMIFDTLYHIFFIQKCLHSQRFIQETSTMLQAPTTPEGESWNTTVQQTPGVIGAQEVYRYNTFFFQRSAVYLNLEHLLPLNVKTITRFIVLKIKVFCK